MTVDVTQCIAAEWCLFGIAVALVIARLAVRQWQRQWKFWVSDVLIVLALLPFLTLVVGDTWIYSKGSGLFDAPTTLPWAKFRFASAMIYDMCYFVPRFSLLAFYYKLFPITEPKLRLALHCIIVYTILAFIASMFIDILWCGTDMKRNWAPDETCASWMAIVPVYTNWPLSISSEVFVFALPFGMLSTLKTLERREKAGLIGIFLLGIATVIVSVVRFVFLTKGLLLYTTYVAAVTEMSTQIVITSLPALRPLLMLGWNRIASQVEQSARKDSEAVLILNAEVYGAIDVERFAQSGKKELL